MTPQLNRTAFFVLLLIFAILSVKAQSPYSIELNASTLIPLKTSFYVEQVIDGRKDSLDNGFAIVNNKKIALKFQGGLAYQVFNFVEQILPSPDSSFLKIKLRISKFSLSERTTAKQIIVKTDMTIQFLRNVNGELTQIYELHTWLEQSSIKSDSKLHEKIIREIVIRILKQFNESLVQHNDELLFKPQVYFKVIHPMDEQPNDDTIYWSLDRKLNWNDFKGKPTNDVYAAQSNCAFAQSLIPIVENGAGIFYINVRAAFFKLSSWYRMDQDTPSILIHEQKHFDIAEWQIRKLRREIASSNLSLSNYLTIINSLYNEAWNKYNSIQNQYDVETEHGTLPDEQEKWNKKIEASLNEFINEE